MENVNDEKINENINNLNNNQNLQQDDKVEIIGVKFEQNGKTYYFSPGTNKYNKGEKVIVETVKGLEIGTVSFGNFLISRKNLVEPLKGITRRATQDDLEKEKKLIEKGEEAKQVCINLAKKYKLEMKLVDVSYMFDETKIVFA